MTRTNWAQFLSEGSFALFEFGDRSKLQFGAHREGAKLAALVKPFVAGRLQGFFNRDGKGEIPTLSTTEAPVQPTVVHVLPIKLFRLTGLHKKCCKKKLF